MRYTTIRLLAMAALTVTGACSAPENTATVQPERGSTAAGTAETPAPDSNDPGNAAQGSAETTYPDASRTRPGNGGIIALAGEATFEFDFTGSQGRCRAAEGSFRAQGVDVDDPSRKVTFEYADIVDPNSGRSVGTAFQLEVRTGPDEVWAAHVGTGVAGKIAEMSLAESTGGGRTLSVTGTAQGFHNRGAMTTGENVPFRLEAICD